MSGTRRQPPKGCILSTIPTGRLQVFNPLNGQYWVRRPCKKRTGYEWVAAGQWACEGWEFQWEDAEAEGWVAQDPTTIWTWLAKWVWGTPPIRRFHPRLADAGVAKNPYGRAPAGPAWANNGRARLPEHLRFKHMECVWSQYLRMYAKPAERSAVGTYSVWHIDGHVWLKRRVL